MQALEFNLWKKQVDGFGVGEYGFVFIYRNKIASGKIKILNNFVPQKYFQDVLSWVNSL